MKFRIDIYDCLLFLVIVFLVLRLVFGNENFMQGFVEGLLSVWLL